MKTSITSGLSKEEEQEVKGEFLSSFRVRERLVYMLEKDIENLRSCMEDLSSFSSPNWSLEQASRAGEIRAKKKLITLLK